MQTIIWVIILACVLVLLWLMMRSWKSGRAILLLGFHEENEAKVSFVTDEWELPRQGRISSKQYRNGDSVLLVPFSRDTGNMAIDLPCYLLYFNGLAYHSHYMSLMDEMDIQYGSRFKPRGKKLLESDLNIYTFDDEQRLAEFCGFVSSHRKAASIEIDQGNILVVVKKGDLQKGLDIIESARAQFGCA